MADTVIARALFNCLFNMADTVIARGLFNCLFNMADTVKTERSSTEFLEQQPHPDLIETENRLKMVPGAFYIPKNNPSKPLGEDAHFISREHQTIGVADGVGGWAAQGIDSGEYARELMSNALSFIVHNYKEGQNIDPKRVLNGAYLNTEAPGSSTALIITLVNGFYLRVANVGDSGFLLIRGGKIMFESHRQQSAFNCPYQVGKSFTSPPSSAMEIMVRVETGDIVVAATDGLFDNVYSYEIEKLVKPYLDDPDMSDLLAWIIAQYALRRAEDSTYSSPFQRAAEEAGIDYVGGKYDDITVVVAYIVAE